MGSGTAGGTGGGVAGGIGSGREPRAIVVGNATIDETYALDALPRPGESLVGAARSTDPGGKGANVAVVLGRCGVGTRLVAVVGDDARGAFVRSRLAAEPVDAALIVSPTEPTDLSIVYRTPDGDNAIVSTVETTRGLPLERAVAALDGARPGALVVLQGNLPEATTLGIAAAARDRGLRVVLNPSPSMPWLGRVAALADTVFVNAGEARALTGRDGRAAVAALVAAGARHVVLTLGADGALLGRAGEGDAGAAGRAIEAVPAVPAEPVDTTGAGDTFMAVALASASLRGVELDARALAAAAAAAALTVGRRGALSSFPTADELGRVLGAAAP